MRVATPDVKQIVLYSLGGMVVAGVYGVIDLFVKRSIGGALEVPTESIQIHDRALLLLLLELEDRCKALDEVAFVRAVDAIDSLVFLRARLQTENVDMLLSDRVDAFMHFKRGEDSLARLWSVVEADMPAREVVYLQKRFKQVIEEIEKHIAAIFLITRDL
jgi:hypothetical protein